LSFEVWNVDRSFAVMVFFRPAPDTVDDRLKNIEIGQSNRLTQ
jgi:hypothetical protein